MAGCVVIVGIVIVVVILAAAMQRSEAREPATRRQVAARWLAAGEAMNVAGYEIAGGRIYVGTGLAAIVPGASSAEPALIDPRLPVDQRNPDFRGSGMSYWPRYAEISPSNRAAYLQWLAEGRHDPDVGIGYVFLYFYGLERRAIFDHARGEVSLAEVDGIREEAERLLSIYGNDNSFRIYASNFIDLCIFLRRTGVETLSPPSQRQGWELPLAVRLALSMLAAENRKLPGEWALSWVRTSPEAALRTPAQRCAEDFRQLFLLRYQDRFGEGLRLHPSKKPLVVGYQPASSTFGGVVPLTTTLPGIVRTEATLDKLRALAEECSQELDAYSRWVGRTGERDSPPAVALLPPALAAGRGNAAARELSGWIEQRLAGVEMAAIESGDLLERWPSKVPGTPARRELETLSDFLASQAVGIEPDAALGGGLLTRMRRAVLFRLPEPRRAPPSPEFAGAATLLQLAAMMAAADGEVKIEEERHLLQHLENALALSPVDRLRLEARFRSLAADPPTLTKVKKTLESIAVRERQPLGAFLVSLAGADGQLHPNEIKLLEKLYPLLGLEAQAVYSDIHQLTSGAAPAGFPAADEPVTMRSAEKIQGFAIPRPPAGAPPPRTIELDLAKVRARLAETEKVSQLLGQIFMVEDDAPPVPRPAPPSDGVRVAGLDSSHSALLRLLAAANSWPRLQVERMAGTLGLLPDGALETINEAAFEICGSALLEGDEILEIDRDVLGEMMP